MNRLSPKTLEEVMLMKFENILNLYQSKNLSNESAAAMLGCSERTFRRKRDRYESEGIDGLLDQRFGHTPPNKIPSDIVENVMRLRKLEYMDYNIKHYHEALCAEHDFGFSYSWLNGVLKLNGLSRHFPRRKKHRRKRIRKPLPGMMIHQDGSMHDWLSDGNKLDLIVTMDDATSEIYSAFLINEEGTNSSFKGIIDTINKKGVFVSLYVDRGSHYAHTPKAGGKIDKERPSQVGRALSQLGIQLIHAYSPQARGRSERMFGTLQNRLPQELRKAKIKSMEAANKYINNVFLPKFNNQFNHKAQAEGSAFMPYVGRDITDILCIQTERQVNNDNTVSYKAISLQIPSDDYRYHYVKSKVMVHEYQDQSLAIFHGPRKLAHYDPQGNIINEQQMVEKAV